MSTVAQHVGPFERLVLLKAFLVAGSPPVEALAALARQAGKRQLAAGTQITTADTALEHAWVVVEGRIGVYQDGQLISSAAPREGVGLLEILARVEDGLELRAEVETLALELRATTLLSVLEDHFVMTRNAIRALSRTLLSTPSWLAASVCRREIAVLDVVVPDGLDLVDRIRLLRTGDVFTHTRLDSLAEVAAQCEEFRAEAGTMLWQEGEPSDWSFVLLDGTVQSTSAQGLRFAWSAGTAPGMIEALASVPRWHGAVAATPVTGLRVSAERFLDALEDDFGMALDVLGSLAVRVRRQQQALGASPRRAPDTPD